MSFSVENLASKCREAFLSPLCCVCVVEHESYENSVHSVDVLVEMEHQRIQAAVLIARSELAELATRESHHLSLLVVVDATLEFVIEPFGFHQPTALTAVTSSTTTISRHALAQSLFYQTWQPQKRGKGLPGCSAKGPKVGRTLPIALHSTLLHHEASR